MLEMFFGFIEKETKRKDTFLESYQEYRGALHNDKRDNSPRRKNNLQCIFS